MHISDIRLEASVFEPAQLPAADRPELSFIGRSNVGKSSLINTLVNRKNLARTSSTPGKTRGIFFYLVNERFRFVDLPGYGYAKVSRAEQKRWAPLVENYLAGRTCLSGCVHLIDCRHEPTVDDCYMAQWLRTHGVATITVATKADKLSRGALLRQVEMIRSALGLFPQETLITFSARTGFGRDLLWKAINRLLLSS